MPAILPKEVLGHMSGVSVEVILPLSASGCLCVMAVDLEKRMFVMFLLFAVHSPLYMLAPLVSGLSVLLLLGFLISLSVYGSSPPPHILRFFAWHLVLSCFSLSLSLPHLFDALMVGWMTEAIRLFHPHTYAELSCPVLHCWFSCSALLKEKAVCDSDAKVGGMGAGGWLNRLTVASLTHSLSHGRYSDK